MRGQAPLVSTVASLKERLSQAASDSVFAAVETQERCTCEEKAAPWKNAREALADVEGILALVRPRLADKANAVAVRQLLLEGSAVLVRLVADLDLFIEEHRGDYEG